ncbi:hypothetical protein JG687_00005019 [Phytophthora cactorum]|uniref:Uncharacterized protein n=1 Tax=Phytophthora cactorum TaxID=29920 RepID=A0A8T1URR4_9STRA|nr:hypothetical protein GQ600_17204 [Phytophthora cactorum]KAG6966114.1 hypothetical protein JG687_00005019 [Phytophthora cactorum]
MASCLDHGTPGEKINNSIRCINAPSAFGKTYMDSLNMQSGLHVVAKVKVARAYQDNAEFGLFALFVTAAFRHSLQTWTSDFFKQRPSELREVLDAQYTYPLTVRPKLM